LGNPILKSRFLIRLIVKLAPAILLFPVIEQTGIDIMPAADLGGTTSTAEQFLYHLAFKL
jgi:hypothetical protein